MRVLEPADLPGRSPIRGLTVTARADTVSPMLYLAGAAVAIAVIAWDGWRRKLAFEASRETDVQGRLGALEKRMQAVEDVSNKTQDALRNGVQEMRQMVAPVRTQILEAQRMKQRA